MISTHPRIARLLRALEDDGAISDRDFDHALYPAHVRVLSNDFWTPVGVAKRAAKLLATVPGTRILDVGAGAGKFCVIAAASTQAVVTGIEHREHLVGVARDAAERVGVSARFLHGDLSCIDWRSFDAFYFYNPFFENVHSDGRRIDDSVEISQRRFFTDVRLALQAMARAPEGTRVVTYHGLGAALPPTYRLESSECAGSDALKLWIQSARVDARSDTRDAGSMRPPCAGGAFGGDRRSGAAEQVALDGPDADPQALGGP